MNTPSTDTLLKNLIPTEDQLVKDSTGFQVIFMLFQQAASRGLTECLLEIDELKKTLDETKSLSSQQELLKLKIEHYEEGLSVTGLRTLIDFLHKPLPSTYSQITWYWDLYNHDILHQETPFFLRFFSEHWFLSIWRKYQTNIENYNLRHFAVDFHDISFFKFILPCLLGRTKRKDISENISTLYYLIGISYSITDLRNRYWNLEEYQESLKIQTPYPVQTTSEKREVDTYARHANLALNYIFRYLEVQDNKSAKTRFSVALKNRTPKERPQDEKEYKLWRSIEQDDYSIDEITEAKKILLGLATFENKVVGEKMKAILDLVEKEEKQKKLKIA